jgi:hypothetical protein
VLSLVDCKAILLKHIDKQGKIVKKRRWIVAQKSSKKVKNTLQK